MGDCLFYLDYFYLNYLYHFYPKLFVFLSYNLLFLLTASACLSALCIGGLIILIITVHILSHEMNCSLQTILLRNCQSNSPPSPINRCHFSFYRVGNVLTYKRTKHCDHTRYLFVHYEVDPPPFLKFRLTFVCFLV